MFRVISGTTNEPDTTAFIELLNSAELQDQFFDSNEEIIVARAPGRLDIMGGIADYSGSLVLELPIQEATFAAVQKAQGRQIEILSRSRNHERTLAFAMRLTDFENADGSPVIYEIAREFFARDPANHWAAYVAGSLLVLMHERKFDLSEGARVLIYSSVPEGKGVSSSAALEVATMQAVAVAFAIDLAPRDLAILCQKVENFVVGAPCGIMDQMTAVFGEANRLLALLCQPAELKGSIHIPDEIAFWGLDSGERHSVAGADYGSVRTGAFMGYRMIADLVGLRTIPSFAGAVKVVDDRKWNCYLANITPAEFEQEYESHLPAYMRGEEFLERFHGTTDSVTRVVPGRTYAVKLPAAHAIYEHDRVRSYAESLTRPITEASLEFMGELMYQSHESYKACGLNSTGTDLLVELVRAAGPKAGLYGAKITGGGSGGTVAVLSRKNSADAIEQVVQQYAERRGYRPYIFTGSSNGSAAFGHLKLRFSLECGGPARLWY